MQVTFWGTRGSIAKPGPSTLRYGGNTSCVQVRTKQGTLLVLDCGTGIHNLGRALVSADATPPSGHLLITHTHWDHIQGFPFFAPLRVGGCEWHVYGPRGVGSSLRDTLAGQMQHTYFPVTLECLGADVRYHDLMEGTFQIGDVHVTAQYLHHPALTLGYRLEADGVSIVYATDHEPQSRALALGASEPLRGEDERHARFLANADLVIHDAQYIAAEYPEKIGWGHSTIESVVQTALLAGVKRLALFHHDPLRDDAAVDGLLAAAKARAAAAGGALQVIAAAEGLVLQVEPAGQPATNAWKIEADSAKAAPPRRLADQSVLVAAKNPETTSTLCGAARKAELHLLEAADGDAVLEIVRAEHPSMIILEHGLPGPDARELCNAVRREHGAYGRAVPIVVAGSEKDRLAHEPGTEPCVTDWLLKPFEQAYVLARMRAWLLRTACRWARAPLPPNEAQRIESLHALGILDTEPEERFDRHTRIAAALFEVPIALVTLIDSNRQWYKSRVGSDVSETSRDAAFCAHAILRDELLVVPDALADDRFADNPFVTGSPHMRFYAGVPLALADGSLAGTLCISDRRPRNLDAAQRSLLQDLGKLVERELRATTPPKRPTRGRGRRARSTAPSE